MAEDSTRSASPAGTVQAAPPAKPAIWNDPHYRALFFQVLVLGGVIAAGAYLINNVISNLERQGIASGFRFLGSTAGFSVSMPHFGYREESSYGLVFLVGLANTLLVSAVGVVFATILGFLIGIARLSSNWVVSTLAAVYIEVLRNIPLLLQLFFWYFAVLRNLPGPRQSASAFDAFFLNKRGLYTPAPVPEEGFGLIVVAIVVALAAVAYIVVWARKRRDETGQSFHTVYVCMGVLIGLPLLAAAVTGFPLGWELPVLKGFNFKGGLELIPEFVALVFALSVYTAAFIAEIVRAGIMAVSHGQTEAARALGLKPAPTLRLVIIPQALRVIIPPLTSQYLNLTKNSSLAAAIAYPDLVLVSSPGPCSCRPAKPSRSSASPWRCT